VLKGKRKWLTNQHVIKRDRKCTVNSRRPKRQKLLTMTFTVRQANRHNCTHHTHPKMSAWFNFLGMWVWRKPTSQVSNPTIPTSPHPAQINPTCGHLWLRLKPNTWTLSDMSLLAAGNDLRPQTRSWYCLSPRIQSQSDVCVEHKEN